MFYINSDISKFFYYINLPCNTSSILLKKTFLELLKYNNEINFNLLKHLCNQINFDWKTELYLLRKNLKSWYKKNYELLSSRYSNIKIDKKFVLLNLIKSLYAAYLTKKHTIEFFDIYNIIEKYSPAIKNDISLIKNKAFIECKNN